MQGSTSYSLFTGGNLKILSFIAKHWEHAEITKESITYKSPEIRTKKAYNTVIKKNKYWQQRRKEKNTHTSDTEVLDEIRKFGPCGCTSRLNGQHTCSHTLLSKHRCVTYNTNVQ